MKPTHPMDFGNDNIKYGMDLSTKFGHEFI